VLVDEVATNVRPTSPFLDIFNEPTKEDGTES
jgi:hypothetical protein